MLNWRPAELGLREGAARAHERRRSHRLVFVGAVEQLYKAPDVLLRALRQCLDRGVDIEIDMVGGGRYLETLEALAAELGLGERVRFHGEVAGGEAVRRLLDAADLFVLPSRTEGLPRAMLEAMARGLPCVGSAMGGIPELLPAGDLVPPGDVDALAAAIEAVLADPNPDDRDVTAESCARMTMRRTS